MSEKLIRESDVIKLIDEWLDNYPLPRHVEKGLASHEELLAYIADAPTIEAKPVVHAHWTYEWDSERDPKRLFVRIVCSNCGLKTGQKSNYCPKCGSTIPRLFRKS